MQNATIEPFLETNKDQAFKEAVGRGQLIASAASMISRGEHVIGTFPKAIRNILEQRAWENFVCPARKVRRSFTSFAELVTAPVSKGGFATSMDFVKALCKADPELEDALDAAQQKGDGGNNNPTGKNQHTDADEEVTVDNVHSDQPARPDGNSRSAALRRLRKDRPDLHKRVINQEISANAAMIEAGFRKKETPLLKLNRAWKKASDEEKKAFLEAHRELLADMLNR